MLHNLDLDQNGQIDFQEFFTAAVDHKTVFTKANIEKVFKIIDQNGDGYIDLEDFRYSVNATLPSNLPSENDEDKLDGTELGGS